MWKKLQVACCLWQLTSGCSVSYPAPAQGLANAEAAASGARAAGAGQHEQASMYLQLAEEALAEARQVMESGDNRRAEEILLRARADAELARQLSREADAKADFERAVARWEAAQPREKTEKNSQKSEPVVERVEGASGDAGRAPGETPGAPEPSDGAEPARRTGERNQEAP